jgi:hypothetical protein
VESITHDKPITAVFSVDHKANKILVGYLNGDTEWVSMDKHIIYDTKRED